MQFRNSIGNKGLQKDLVEITKNNRVHHTQLFLGKEGNGALAFVLAYAQYLLCLNPKEYDSCGECSQCHKMERMIHPDVHFTFPTITSVEFKKPISDNYIAEFREFFKAYPFGEPGDWANFLEANRKKPNITAAECLEIIKTARYQKLEGKYKINIIWNAEKLAKEGNRLLKILEEPPENTLFLLIATNEDQILNTILSRTQINRLVGLSELDIENYLVKHKEIAQTEAKKIAILADGHINDALLLSDNAEQTDYSLLTNWLKTIISNKPKLVDFVSGLQSESKENLKNLLTHATLLCRETLILQEGSKLGKLPEQEQKIAEWLGKKLTINQIHQLSTNFDNAAYAIERNADITLLFMKLSIEIDELLEQREAVK